MRKKERTMMKEMMTAMMAMSMMVMGCGDVEDEDCSDDSTPCVVTPENDGVIDIGTYEGTEYCDDGTCYQSLDLEIDDEAMNAYAADMEYVAWYESVQSELPYCGWEAYWPSLGRYYYSDSDEAYDGYMAWQTVPDPYADYLEVETGMYGKLYGYPCDWLTPDYLR
jgi:hypothetical protein